MAEKLPPIPYSAKIIDGQGIVTMVWADWFRSASVRMGGNTAKTNVELDRTVTGSAAAPVAVTAAGGIAPAGALNELIFVQGDGGAVDVTKNPQIAAGTAAGQVLELIGCSGTNTVKLDDGTGLSLTASRTLAANSVLGLVWSGSVWIERYWKA